MLPRYKLKKIFFFFFLQVHHRLNHGLCADRVNLQWWLVNMLCLILDLLEESDLLVLENYVRYLLWDIYISKTHHFISRSSCNKWRSNSAVSLLLSSKIHINIPTFQNVMNTTQIILYVCEKWAINAPWICKIHPSTPLPFGQTCLNQNLNGKIVM